MTALDAARRYLSRHGWHSVPLPYRRKRPVLKGWQTLRLSQEALALHFNGHAQNLGVLLGAPSGGLVDLDLDSREALALAPFFLPKTLTFGRASRPRSHWLYVAREDTLPETTKYQVHRRGEDGQRVVETFLEVRSTGGQTVFPPSVHPSGEAVRWEGKGEPLRIDGPELSRFAGRLAAACLFLRRWPRQAGARQDHAQALAGALIRSGFTVQEAEHFLFAVARCAGDEEAKSRAQTAVHAARHHEAGTPFWGWPTVAAFFGAEVADLARTWLGVTEADQKEPIDSAATVGAAESETSLLLPEHVYDLLPTLLQEGVGFFEARHQRDVFLTALLGALSAALPNVRFLYGKAYHSAHLYFFVLARAASGKGVMEHAFRWLGAVDELLQREWAEEKATWQGQKEAFERAKRSRKESFMMPDPPGAEPPERCLVAGANTTAAALGARLAANPEGVFIGSTEADALTSANRREHGNFSHLMRQAFHHEAAQIDRKTEQTLRIKHPRLALVLSGTPKQFPRFMDGGVEDGLYSRFGLYRFEAATPFVSQRPKKKDHELEDFTEYAARQVRALYEVLRGREDTLYFDVPAGLWDQMDTSFRALHDHLVERGGGALRATVLRGELIAFRIALMLSVWRQFERGTPLGRVQHVTATEADVEAGRALGLVYAQHALTEALHMEPEVEAPIASGARGESEMSETQLSFLEALPERFTTREAEGVAGAQGVSRSTLYDWLVRLTETGTISKVKRGCYQQVARVGNRKSKSIGLLDFPRNWAGNGDSALDFPLDFRLDVGLARSAVQGKVQEVQRKVQSENGPDGTKKGESPIVQEVQWTNANASIPALRKGQRVRVPEGKGEVLQVFAKRVTVLLDGAQRTRFYAPEEVTPLA